jgi:putative nucleotidyltransferase with HDIG domain
MWSWWQSKTSPWLRLTYGRITKHPGFRRVAWCVVFFLIAVFILSSSFFSKGYALKEGEISTSDIRAPRSISYTEDKETARLRNEAASRVQKIYRENTQAAPLVNESVRTIFAKVTELQDAKITSDEQLSRMHTLLAQITGASADDLQRDISDQDLQAFLKMSPANLTKAQSLSLNFLQDAMKFGLTMDALPSAKKSLKDKVDWADLPSSLKPAVTFILTDTIKPNMEFDQDTYNKQVTDAQNAVPPVQRSIQAGQVIVREGDPITSSNLAVLSQLGLLRGRVFWPVLLGSGFLVLLLVIFTLIYLYKFRRYLLHNDQFVLLYGLLFIITLALAKVATFLQISTQPEVAILVGYLAPLAMGAMLITVLIDSGLAIFTAFILSVMLGIMMDGQISFVIFGLVGSLAGIFSISGLSERTGLIRGGAYVSLANTGAIFGLGLLNATSASTVLSGIGMGVLNGFLCSVLTLGLLPYLESAFGITSSVRLLELSNPNQVLLKRLLMEAPGTYHHSILVGNLAEAAAQAVQADPLLVRVGSYYHDIGKLKRPYFFIENQLARENPHDKIAPSLSTLIITSHVKDGLELAREYKLPSQVENIIEQHHGTGLVAYFYQRALDSDRPEQVAESDFRYDSVKPQSKEAALVMLADSVEAAIRSLQKPTPGRLEGLTRKIIKEKLHDGQLDECDLTFKDLDRIATAFVRVLAGIFHTRIEYPESMITEIERRRSRGAVVNQ